MILEDAHGNYIDRDAFWAAYGALQDAGMNLAQVRSDLAERVVVALIEQRTQHGLGRMLQLTQSSDDRDALAVQIRKADTLGHHLHLPDRQRRPEGSCAVAVDCRSDRERRGVLMPAITLTPARAAVLKAVGDGEVTHWGSLNIDKADWDQWSPHGGPSRKVTREVKVLAELELITYRRELGRLTADWQLTEAGEQWLAENKESA